jgi:PPOX class probable F420-dependent enzyme
VKFTPQQRTFLEHNHGAAMVTLRPDGTPHVVRVGVGLVGEQLWSSGVPSRLRTRQLRRDPRCTLFVFNPTWDYLTLETRVTIHEGPQAAEMNLRLFTEMQKGLERPPGTLLWYGQPKTEQEFLQAMRDEQRLIYAFDEPRRVYGLITTPG